ncbi:MAG: flagellar hook-basal body complex protein FliE [Candidatus Competibacteraceae bacterium]|nr:flagellar hook-basal body complex protein FliE [Candidatus Competibacteraceae bacterium]
MNSINANRPLADPARPAGALAGAAAIPAGADSATSSTDDFAAMLKAMLGDVNRSQNRATEMAETFDRGESQDLAGAMIAQQKARLNFQATLQARNKLVSAYQDIMNMPI